MCSFTKMLSFLLPKDDLLDEVLNPAVLPLQLVEPSQFTFVWIYFLSLYEYIFSDFHKHCNPFWEYLPILQPSNTSQLPIASSHAKVLLYNYTACSESLLDSRLGTWLGSSQKVSFMIHLTQNLDKEEGEYALIGNCTTLQHISLTHILQCQILLSLRLDPFLFFICTMALKH